MALSVVRDDAAEDELGVRAHHPEWDDDVARFERARRGFRQHRGEEHVVLGADDRRAATAQVARDVGAGETAADDQRSAPCLQIGHGRILLAHLCKPPF
jgi:hypothetical protein